MATKPLRADLHIHTTASDGLLRPEEVVALAAKQGLSAIAITDHDSTEGIDAALAAAAKHGIRVIPGVEISTDVPRGEVHVLGYCLDHHHPELKATLDRMRSSRQRRAQRMVAKLARLGIRISMERVLELAAGGAVGRPHVAQVMVEAGYVASSSEAFERYIGRTGPAYAEREKMTPEEAVALIARLGGLPVLAHPADIEDLEARLPGLLAAGLVGMETYYSEYAPEVIERLVGLAAKHGLIATGGSDFHGGEKAGITYELGSGSVPFEAVEQLLALAKDRAFTKVKT